MQRSREACEKVLVARRKRKKDSYQFAILSALGGTDMEKNANVLKGSKIGQELRNIFGKLYENSKNM